ncbi:MAG: haloacid dehalogenase-like hydrolase [Deltaproteobacteria bacterium]|nr:haloacid dehalogenase-like hydrolase [Deltaproteobacteria bacterium]
MLLLFDIDGTLIRCGGAGRRALDQAFSICFGIEGALDRVRLDGSTDPRIVEDAFRLAFGRAPEPREVERVLERYLVRLEDELSRAADSYQVLAGVRELMSIVTRADRFVVGLATGNVERGARLKLARGGLNAFFELGGFGSDAADRAELVRHGIERGQRRAEVRFGRRFAPEEIWVFGDTAADVVAARAAGAVAVGVLHGSGVRDELTGAKPDVMLESLADPALLARIGG